jgi:dipeptidyl aminopeptidase/acylaminoacyl peptidase
MRPVAWILSVGLCVAAALTASDAAAPNENLVAEGIPNIPASLAAAIRPYTEARSAALGGWHPERREILITTRFADTPQLHLVRFPGGARQQLTFFAERVLNPSFRPGRGDFIVFSQDAGGGEFFQYQRLDPATGKITLLTDGKSRNLGLVWNRQGDRIAYVSTRRSGKDTDLYAQDPSDPKSDRLVAELSGGGWQPLDWSPDGRRILVREGISVNEAYLWLVDAATGEKMPLTERGGKETIAWGGAQFLPDGKALIASCDEGSEFLRLVRMDLATRRREVLTPSIPWDVEIFDVARDGRRVAFVTNEEGASVLRVRDLASGRDTVVPGLAAGTVGAVEWHANGRELAFSYTDARSPSDVSSFDADSGKIERWTQSEVGGLNPASLRQAEIVRWKSFDGRTISGLLYTPPASFEGKRPVIVNIHGGPEGQSRPGFLARNNYLIDELGVAILYPNVRGSTGFGKTFSKLDNGKLRENSVKDIGAALDWIATRPDLDASRIMITGGSYGGFMTLASAVAYNDRIRCALDVVGISNFVSFLERTSGYRQDLRRVEYGDERDPEMRSFFERISPLTNASRIRKPLFVVAGANDPRVPRSESDQIVKTVRANGTPVWSLVALDEGHGFGKKRNQDYQFAATVLFVQEYLLK